MTNRGYSVSLVYKILDYFSTGNERSVRAKKNILASFLFKGIIFLVAAVRVPVLLEYLDTTNYGIWITIGSIVGWFGFFDLGLGNGLRNKLAEALAKNDIELAKIFISTTYVAFVIIMGVCCIVFLSLNTILDWSKILNVSSDFSQNLSLIVQVVFIFFSIKFILELINIVFLANQLPAAVDALKAINGVVYLLLLVVLLKTTSSALIYVAIVSGFSQVLVLFFASLFVYKNKYTELTPSFNYVRMDKIKGVMILGSKFFIIQIGAMVLFATDSIIISQLYEPSAVVPYNIAFTYFFYVVLLFSIVVSPLWSAITEAFKLEDYAWIKNIMRKTVRFWIALLFVVVFMLMIADFVYKIWVGDKISFPFELSFGMALFAIVRTWNSPFSSFINGVGKVKIQMYATIISSLINIPLSIFLAKTLGFGVTGVIYSTVLCLLLTGILLPIQYRKIILGRATGIWNA